MNKAFIKIFTFSGSLMFSNNHLFEENIYCFEKIDLRNKFLKEELEKSMIENCRGKINQIRFKYLPNSKTHNYKKQIMRKGDIYTLQELLFNSALDVITKLSESFLNVFLVYRLFDKFSYD